MPEYEPYSRMGTPLPFSLSFSPTRQKSTANVAFNILLRKCRTANEAIFLVLWIKKGQDNEADAANPIGGLISMLEVLSPVMEKNSLALRITRTTYLAYWYYPESSLLLMESIKSKSSSNDVNFDKTTQEGLSTSLFRRCKGARNQNLQALLDSTNE